MTRGRSGPEAGQELTIIERLRDYQFAPGAAALAGGARRRQAHPMRLFFGLGCIFGALAVALGAFGAHGLRATLSAPDLATFETGVRYHLVHSLALLAAAWAVDRWGGTPATVAGWAFVVGIVVFSGSLYMLVLTGPRWLGAIPPIGGVALILGWALHAWTALTGR